MAHIAASSHPADMPSRIWLPPSSSSPPTSHPSILNNQQFTSLPSFSDALTPSTTALPTWPPLSTSLPSNHSDLPSSTIPALSLGANMSNYSGSSSADPNLDIDAIFQQLLRIPTEDPPQPSSVPMPQPARSNRSISVYAPPFYPAEAPPTVTSTVRLSSPLLTNQGVHPQNPFLSSAADTSRATIMLPTHRSSAAPSLALGSSYSTNEIPQPSAQPVTQPSVDNASAPLAAPMLRPSSVPSPPNAGIHSLHAMAGPAVPQVNQTVPRIKNELYKTEICRSYAETGGFCKYGSKCQFAHGEHELRPVRRHPRYKTKLCRNFVTTGTCPYAARCRFIHATDVSYQTLNTMVPPMPPLPPLPSVPGLPPSTALQSVSALTSVDALRAMPIASPLSSAMPSASGYHGPGDIGRPRQGSDLQPDPHATDNYESLQSLFLSTPGDDSTNVDDIVNSHNADRDSSSSPRDAHPEKPAVSVTPTDQVYHANANVFQSYPDAVNTNVIYNELMSLTVADSNRYSGSENSGRGDSLRTSSRTGGNISAVEHDEHSIARHFGGLSVSNSSSLFTHSPATPRASPSSITPNGAVHAVAGAVVADGDTSITGSTTTAPVAPPMSRSRLPVFRNLASDEGTR